MVFAEQWTKSILSLREPCTIPFIYWPSTEPSIKRCTCVNKWKKSRSRWALGKNIGRCSQGRRGSRRQECQSENQLADWGLWPQRPPVEQPKPRCGRSAAMVKRRTWVNIAVCPCRYSSLTHHRNIKNKVGEIYFCGEVCLFIKVVIIVYYVSSLYLRKWLYNIPLLKSVV